MYLLKVVFDSAKTQLDMIIHLTTRGTNFDIFDAFGENIQAVLVEEAVEDEIIFVVNDQLIQARGGPSLPSSPGPLLSGLSPAPPTPPSVEAQR